jgi:hypothetical protein
MSAPPPTIERPDWSTLPEPELLATRICDLGLQLEGSPIEPHVQALYGELEHKGVSFRPLCYLGDEWFSPEDVPAISIPFYFAHPRLLALEQKMMLEVEGGEPESFQRLLRHECGHAIEHAFQLHRRRKRQELFGRRTQDYDPDTYRPHPYSRSYVRHLPNWYAQAHPDEDFAETFAVWLDPKADWRRQYARWRALAKLEYVDQVMAELRGKPPTVTAGRLEFQACRLRSTLGRFYQRRQRLSAADAPNFYDNDLRTLFAAPGEAVSAGPSAAAFMRRHRRQLIDSVARWTGERKVTIEHLVRRLTVRARQLGLCLGRDEAQTSIEVSAYLATLVTHYRFTGKFKRTV